MPNFKKGMQNIQNRQQQSQNPLAGGLFENIGIAQSDAYGIQMIDYDLLYISPLNTYSVDPDVIEELADQIEDIGLEQPLIVVETNGKYEILGGQRRFLAIGIIRTKNKEKFKKVPCKVDDLLKVPDKIKDLPDEIKKIYITASTNNNRVMTGADYRLMVDQLGQVYDALQANGQKVGEKRRAFIARQAGIGERTVQQVLSAEKKMDAKLMEQIQGNPNVSINMAEQLSKLPDDQQKDLAERLSDGEQIAFEDEMFTSSSDDVSDFQNEDPKLDPEPEEIQKEEKEPTEIIPMSQEEIASMLRVGEMSDLLVMFPHNFKLSEKDRKKVESIGEKIQKLQDQIRKITKKVIDENE